MKIKKLVVVIACVASLLHSGDAMSWFWSMDRALTVGYRRDTLANNLIGLDSSGKTILKNSLNADCIKVYDVGIQGKFLLCNTLLLRGFAELGWGNDGHYREKTESLLTLRTLSKTPRVSSRDYSIALGYSFSSIPFLRIEPLLGYAFDFLQTETERMPIIEAINTTPLRLQYSMWWEGPWVGLDTTFEAFGLRLKAGYEFHKAEWNGQWQLLINDSAGFFFSDKRHSNDAHGQVTYVEGSCNVSQSWSVGFGCKYQCWEAHHGRDKVSIGSFPGISFFSINKAKIKKASWESCQVKLMLGCSF